jgi:hypothetical protein
MTSVINAFNNMLTFQDNFSCVINTVSITAGASDTDNIAQFKVALSRPPIMLILTAVNASGSFDVIYPQASWYYSQGSVYVNGIQGLTSGTQYNLTFFVT